MELPFTQRTVIWICWYFAFCLKRHHSSLFSQLRISSLVMDLTVYGFPQVQVSVTNHTISRGHQTIAPCFFWIPCVPPTGQQLCGSMVGIRNTTKAMLVFFFSQCISQFAVPIGSIRPDRHVRTKWPARDRTPRADRVGAGTGQSTAPHGSTASTLRAQVAAMGCGCGVAALLWIHQNPSKSGRFMNVYEYSPRVD